MNNKLTSLYDLAHKDCLFSVSAYYAQNFTFFEMAFHTHTSFEIMYVAKGICNIFYILKGQEYQTCLKPGEWIFIDSHTTHKLIVDPSAPCRMLNLEVELLETTASAASVTSILKTSSSILHFLEHKEPIIVCRDLSESDKIQEALHTIHLYAENKKDYHSSLLGDHLLVDLEILKLLTLIAHKYKTQNDNLIGLHYIKKAKSYIDEHFDNPLSIKEITAYVGISSSYLQRLFSKQLGMSIIDYIIKKRIDKAIMLLKHTNASIIDISIESGFNSRQHFTHTFKKAMEISPHAFRNMKDNYQILLPHNNELNS